MDDSNNEFNNHTETLQYNSNIICNGLFILSGYCCGINKHNKKKLYRHAKIEFNKGIIKECCICLNDIDKNSSIIVLSCNHIYHKNCITRWFNKNKTCPICRINIE